METQLIKLIWALNETVELDIDEIATKLNVDPGSISDIIATCCEMYSEIRAEEKAYEDYCSNHSDDDDENDDNDAFFVD